MDERRRKARRRALRAAQVVTLALALGTGCSSNEGPGDAAAMDASARDASSGDAGFDAATPDSGTDATVADAGFDATPDSGTDASVTDAGFDAATPDSGADAAVADAGFDAADCAPPYRTRACCEAAGGSWNEMTDMCLIAVPGPFVPPAMA